MKILVEASDLLTIASWILTNCDGLDDCDEDDIEDLVPFHSRNIRQLAEDLRALALVNEKRTTEQQPSADIEQTTADERAMVDYQIPEVHRSYLQMRTDFRKG